MPEGKTPTLRFDAVATLAKAEVLENGWLRAPAAISRAGVFEYRSFDGTVRRELRPPEEVFSVESVKSFEQVPLTDEHPSAGRLDAANTRDALVIGSLGEGIKREGHFLRGRVMVTDAEAVAQILAGKKVQLSCGYVCDMDETPGEWRGQKYDAVQRNIRGNHVALVAAGRAGPDVRVKLDNAAISVVIRNDGDNYFVADKGINLSLKKIRLDGIEFEVEESTAQAVEKYVAANDASFKVVEKKADEATARADSLEAELTKVKKDLAEAPAKVKAELKARMDLEATAREFLGAEIKLDEMDERGVQLAVIEKITPGSGDLKEKSADYVNARFDFAVELARKADPMAGVGAALVRNDAEKANADTVEAAREKFQEAARNAHKNVSKQE